MAVHEAPGTVDRLWAPAMNEAARNDNADENAKTTMQKEKGPTACAEGPYFCDELITVANLVGSTGFEPVTPAV